MNTTLSENNFDIKLRNTTNFMFLLKDKIIFESGYKSGIKYYADLNEPSIDGGINISYSTLIWKALTVLLSKTESLRIL